MIYRYIIDNNEYYDEDHRQYELIATEKLTIAEFEALVRKAFKLCGEFPNYARVARKIIEIDDRFIDPEYIATAYIGRGEEIGDNKDKIRGVYGAK